MSKGLYSFLDTSNLVCQCRDCVIRVFGVLVLGLLQCTFKTFQGFFDDRFRIAKFHFDVNQFDCQFLIRHLGSPLGLGSVSCCSGNIIRLAVIPAKHFPTNGLYLALDGLDGNPDKHTCCKRAFVVQVKLDRRILVLDGLYGGIVLEPCQVAFVP